MKGRGGGIRCWDTWEGKGRERGGGELTADEEGAASWGEVEDYIAEAGGAVGEGVVEVVYCD